MIPPCNEKVVLAWVRDTVPLIRYAGEKEKSNSLTSSETVKALETMVAKIFEGAVKKAAIFDLGDSDRLRGFYRMYQQGKVSGDLNKSIYFLRASASDSFLAMKKDQDYPVVRLAQTDDRLIEALLRELQSRMPGFLECPEGVNWNKGEVVLITESDTTYSRALVWQFYKSLQKHGCNPPKFVYTYLRGLDGAEVTSIGDKQNQYRVQSIPSVGEAVETAMKHRFISETSSGTSQFDYLRRLATRLRARERKGPILAVGVLGSDVYDKILVLQALRRELPQTSILYH